MSYYEFCRQTLQKSAPDLYLLSLMGKASQLEKLWALYAFDYELGKIRRSVSEPTLALIRLQWWRDELSKIKQDEIHSKSEILCAIKSSDLNVTKLEALIDAKEAEIRLERPPQTIEEAIEYLQNLHAPLCDLVSHVDGGKDSADTMRSIALNRGIMQALYNAKKKSFVHENKTELSQYFDISTKAKGRNLAAMLSHSNIHFKRIKMYEYDACQPTLMKPPPLEALRIWTSLIGK